ncbi:MAG TPA: hypothetical protein VF299_04845 [Mycobacterium sp.]
MASNATGAVPQVVSVGLGLLMAITPALGSAGLALVVSIAAVLAVLAAVAFRPAATLAVLLAMSAIMLANTTPLLAAVSGFCAAAYLVLRYAAMVTAPTLTAVAGFTLVGLVAAAFPLSLPWLPLAAPLAALGCYVLVALPFLRTPG